VSAVQSVDYAAIAPPVVVAAGAVVVLVVDLVVETSRPRRRWLVGGLALLTLLIAAGTLVPLRDGTHRTFCVPAAGPLPPACSYVADNLALVVQVVVLAGAAVVVLASFAEWALPGGEYHFLLLSSVAGALTVAAARDLATLVIALEVVSLPSFAMVALRRDAAAAEAALTAFLTSVVATAVTVMGVAFTYAGTGTLFLARTAPAIADAGVRQPLVLAGLVMVLAAPAFKLAAVPLHAWAPDTYVGSPLPVAAYLSVVSKAAGLVALLIVVLVGFGPAAGTWAPAVAVLAAATVLIGNLGALRQRSAVRLLAWSSIAQAGYILVPVAAAAPARLHALAASASVAFLAAYAAMNLGAFAVIGVAAPPGVPPYRLRVEDFRGLARSRPWIGVSLAFFLACLAGLPPGVIGLVTKVRILEVPVRSATDWLAVVVVVGSVIGLAYYLRFAALLFAEPHPTPSPGAPNGPPAGSRAGRVAGPVAVGLMLAVTVLLSVFPVIVVGLLAP
jgi:NADH-quinone oxidoreductase subunit N